MLMSLESFTFCDTQIFGDKKDIVSVPDLTFLGFLAYDSLHIISIVLLALKAWPDIVRDRPSRYL